MTAKDVLEKQRRDELSRALDFVERYRGDVSDVHGEKEHRYDPDGDEPGTSDCACRACAFDFREHVECVSPSNVRGIRLDISRRECVGVGRAPFPDVVKVSERIRDASEPPQNGHTRDRDAMEHC